jgi:vancomycin resistance protein YoaR
VARSTRRDDRPGRESEGGRVVLALVLGLGLLAGGGYFAAYLAAGDKVPVGTTIAGVDIGGRDPSSAMQALRDGLVDRADAPFTVVVNGRAQQIRPSEVGLNVDYTASVRAAGAERSWRPSRLWRYFTAGSSYDPVVSLDQDRLGGLLQRLDVSDGRTAADGSVVFRHGTFIVRPPRPGLVLDPRVAGTAFWNAYLSDAPSVQLRMAPTAPTIDAAAIDRFVKHFANPAMASPVELHFGPATLHLAPSAYSDLLAAQRVGDRLRPRVREQPLFRMTQSQLVGAPIERPEPATVALVDGRPQVVKARPGMRFTPGDTASALLRAIASPQRSARVHPTVARAAFTNADARRLGIRRQLATYTVHVPRGSYGARLSAAVSRLDGTVLKPGQTLSLRGRLGGRTPSGSAGDSLATALFNAAWLGGLQVSSHAVGAAYDRRAPVGRDASLRDGRDLAFVDNTRYGVLVTVTTSGRSVAATLWSTPRWTVTSSHGARRHVVTAGRDVVRTTSCTPREGRDGFDVTVTRTFARGGDVDRTSSYTATYAPRDAVVCKARHRHHHR